MISIITAIYNQLDMNKIYWDSILKCTDNEFELIIIDNVSTDGSRQFFQSLGGNVTVIANDGNYSYPYCQNQGLAIAKYPVLAFLNNDMLLSPHWDTRVMEVLGNDNHDVLSLASNDRIHDKKATKKISRRWKRIKYPIMALFGGRKFGLKLMTRLCYGNWDKYCDKIFKRYGYSLTVGFSGHAIVMNRAAIAKIGEWDPAQQGADYDIFYRTCQRNEAVGDIQKLAIVNGIFSHHYRRLTLYAKHPPFADGDKLSSIDAKWNEEDRERWKKVVKFR